MHLIFLVGLLTELYLSGEETFNITEVGKVIDVKIESSLFFLKRLKNFLQKPMTNGKWKSAKDLKMIP